MTPSSRVDPVQNEAPFGGNQRTPILLVGPSTVGKSDLAFALAEQLGGEVINADKFYLFSGFPRTTGLPDFEAHPTVRTHLYQILSPWDAPLDEMQFGVRAAALVHEIAKRGGLPIVEGCYHRYARALISATPGVSWIRAGLRWSPGIDVLRLVQTRVNDVFHNRHGIEEVRAALEQGYRETYVMRFGSMVRPLVEYLDGQISLEAAHDKAIAEILAAAYKALRRFLDFPSVTWYSHDVSRTVEIVQALKAQVHTSTREMERKK